MGIGRNWNDPSMVEPSYMRGDSELTEERASNDDNGNTLADTERYLQGRVGYSLPGQQRRGAYHPPGEPRDWEIGIDTRNWGRKEQEEQGISGWGQNYPFYTGGTFLHPEYLPPVRTYHLQ